MNNIINDFEFYNVHITEKMSGKMEGMSSISTSPLFNEQCLHNRTIAGSVCEECFSFAQLECFKRNFPEALERNTAILTKIVIPAEFLPRINKFYFRFEAFGDIANETHFINYLNICEANPRTTFTIWTKSPHIMSEVLNDMSYKKPKNLIIVTSSLFLNLAYKLETLHYKKKYWFIDKIFTVYTADFALKHRIVINCGDNKCLKCLKCYTFNDIIYINEILKKEQKFYYEAVAILKDYQSWLNDEELTHNVETLDLYISGLRYALMNEYTGKNQTFKATVKWAEKQEKKIKSIINEYYEAWANV